MRDTINILGYWIKELRKIVEFQEIAKVEDIEFLRLYGATQQIEDNMYIVLADEYGIKRMEKIAGIYPDANDTLEQRRTRLYSYWNDRRPYTLEELKSRLKNICGSDDFEVDMDYPNFHISINTHVGGYGVFEEITNLLDYYLPANLVLELQNLCKGTGTASVYVGTGTVTAMSYTVTNDINGTYPLTQEMYLASPMGVSEGHLVTNDINVGYTPQMALNGAVGVLTGADVTVTNDINSKMELSEDKTVGEAVSTSMVITLTE